MCVCVCVCVCVWGGGGVNRKDPRFPPNFYQSNGNFSWSLLNNKEKIHEIEIVWKIASVVW